MSIYKEAAFWLTTASGLASSVLALEVVTDGDLLTVLKVGGAVAGFIAAAIIRRLSGTP
jgi:hypothetical protein